MTSQQDQNQDRKDSRKQDWNQKRNLKNMFSSEKPPFSDLLDLLFPRKCMLCHKIPEEKDGRFQRLGLCGNCRIEDFSFDPERLEVPVPDWIHVSFRYEQEVRYCLAQLKYEGMKEYGTYFGGWMYDEGKDLLAQCIPQCSLITWVPLAEKRAKQRGYNQSELIGRSLAEKAGIPCAQLLIRTRETAPQKDLGEEMRRRNVEGAFAPAPGLRPGELKGKSILLIDDIFTTGATLESCRNALKRAEPDAKVIGWTLSA